MNTVVEMPSTSSRWKAMTNPIIGGYDSLDPSIVNEPLPLSSIPWMRYAVVGPGSRYLTRLVRL